MKYEGNKENKQNDLVINLKKETLRSHDLQTLEFYPQGNRCQPYHLQQRNQFVIFLCQRPLEQV